MKKIILSLLILLLFTFPCMAEEDHIFIWDNFSRGLNSHISVYNVSNYQQAHTAQNVRINDEYGSISKRPTMVLKLDGGSASINGIHRYYKTDDTAYTVFATSTLLRYDNDGTATTIKTGLSDGEWWQFVTYTDTLIGWNGSDAPVKWDGATTTTANTDGARTANELCADLGAPFAELDTGTDLDASSWYQYKVAFYDGSTYHYNDARSNPIVTGSSVHNIALTDIPIGPSGTTHRYIYRTLGNSSQANVEADTTFYLVGTLSDNTTTTFSDDVTDNTADDDAAPKWSTVSAGTNSDPPTCKYGTIHKERLFLGNNSTYPSTLYWSDEYNPDFFSASDYEIIREDDGGEITFINELLGLLIIGKTNAIVHYYTNADDDGDWYASAPYTFIGCPSPYSVAVTPIGLIYYNKGLYTFIGESVKLISDSVTPEMNDVSETAIEEVVGYYFNGEYHFAYTSKSSDEGDNNRVLVYDIVRDAYVLDHKDINCFCAFTGGSDFGQLYSGSSTTDGYIYAHGGAPTSLDIRYGSQVSAGTHDDTRDRGTEKSPIVEIAWDCTIDGWLTELQTKDASITTIDSIETYLPDATIDRPDTDGDWTSDIYRINAGALERLYWNESLGSYGDVDLYIKTCDDAACSGDSFGSAYTDPTGSDVSSETAQDWVQIKASLSTTDIDYTPILYTDEGYMIKLVYSVTGATQESSFLSKFESGWIDLEPKGRIKRLKRIRVFYEGDSGDIDFRYYNEEGDIDTTFTIDLDVIPEQSTNDNYSGLGDEKIYTHYCTSNIGGLSPISRLWWFDISDESTDDWKIKRIEVKYAVEPEMD